MVIISGYFVTVVIGFKVLVCHSRLLVIVVIGFFALRLDVLAPTFFSNFAPLHHFVQKLPNVVSRHIRPLGDLGR
jgi:hypothetical protein